MRKKRLRIFKIATSGYLLSSLVLIVIGALFFQDLKDIFVNPESIQIAVSQTGALGVIILISLQVLQSILLFIPGSVITIASGFLFGAVYGTIFSIIGIMIGSMIVFNLGRRLGRTYIKTKFNKKDLKKFDQYFHKRGKLGLFISRLVFFLPHDLISFLSGSTPISYFEFFIITLLGHLPLTILGATLGDKISGGATLTSLIIISILGIVALLFIFRDLIRLCVDLRRSVKKYFLV